MNGAVPFVTFKLTLPLGLPQVASVGVATADGQPILFTVALAIAEQPFASVTVTVYNFAGRLEIFCVVAVLLQRYVNGAVPLVTFRLTLPLVLPQVASVGVAVAMGGLCCPTVALAVAVHPFASVTVTV